MKKFFLTFGAFVLLVTAIQAANFKVDVSKTNLWGEAKFEASTYTLTFSEAWQGCGWWLAKDCSEYEKVEIRFASPLPMDATFMVIYNEKNEKGENVKQMVDVPSGTKETSISLDKGMKVSVDGLGLSVKASGQIVIKSITIK